MRFDSFVRLVLATGAAVLALSLSPAIAQDEESTVPETLLAMVGDWLLEQEDQSLPDCPLVFTEEETAHGWRIEVPEPCPSPFPPAAAFASWDIDPTDGAVLITDPAGRLVLRLIEGEDGLFLTAPDIFPAFYLMLPWDADGVGGEIGDEF